MDVREKLIELLKQIRYVSVENAADILIANGVTIREPGEWIPVTERLPEDDSDVLAYLQIGDKGRIYPAIYAYGMWFDCIFATPATSTTTHWMPLPETPKEDNHE